MSGSAVASLATAEVAPEGVADALSSPEDLEPGGAGSLRWQRAQLVLDQHQRGVGAGPTGQVLPVHAELAHLLPHRGLRRGSTVVVRGSITVLLALLAEATAEGSWAAVVGMPELGVLAAAELGVAVSRLALVPRPGAEFGAVVAALLDGLDLVAVAATGTLTTEDNSARRTGPLTTLARRLSARARHRESVLLSFGPWPGADLELTCTETHWSGLGNGYGHLTERELTVTTQGRGAASKPISGRVRLPANKNTPQAPATREPADTSRSTTSKLAQPLRPIDVPKHTESPNTSTRASEQASASRPASVAKRAATPPTRVPNRIGASEPAASRYSPVRVLERASAPGVPCPASGSEAAGSQLPRVPERVSASRLADAVECADSPCVPAKANSPGASGPTNEPEPAGSPHSPAWSGSFRPAGSPSSDSGRPARVPGPAGSLGPHRWLPDALALAGSPDLLRPTHLSAVPDLVPATDEDDHPEQIRRLHTVEAR